MDLSPCFNDHVRNQSQARRLAIDKIKNTKMTHCPDFGQ